MILGLRVFAEALGAANCSAGAGGAAQFKDVAAVGEQLVDFFGSSLAFDHHVRANVRGIQGRIGRDGAVDNDDRDIGILGFRENSIPAGFNHWGQRNDIHTLLDAGADGRDLVFLLLLGIREDQS